MTGESIDVEFAGQKVRVPKGGYYDRFRSNPDLDEVARDPAVDLQAITVPTLILQGDDDQVVPYKNAALKQHELIRGSEMKIYPGAPSPS